MPTATKQLNSVTLQMYLHETMVRVVSGNTYEEYQTKCLEGCWMLQSVTLAVENYLAV